MQIIIDPGHGGFDPGGGRNNFFKEKDLNLLISKYQNARFKELGINSNLVRDKDETLTPKARIDRINSFSPTSSEDARYSWASGPAPFLSFRETEKPPLFVPVFRDVFHNLCDG